MPILVLETVGRRSGVRRTNPVVYLPDGDNLVVVPANAGNQVPPDWWLNLRAAGEGIAILGQERRRVTPHEATGAERARLWRHFAARTPVEHYQAITPRRIPVVVLAPAVPPVTPTAPPLDQ
jgi:deazaflavin-dependent oxidoreductase (nitroreductase family)